MHVGVRSDNVGFVVKTMQIYEYDDYDDCRRSHPDFVYCIVQLRLQPDPTSVIWNSIQNYSSSPRHFDRRSVEVGSCLQECHPPFERNSEHITTLLDVCLRTKVWSLYKLNSTIERASCSGAVKSNAEHEDGWKIAAAKVTFVCWAVGALFLVSWATLLDTGSSSRASEKLNTPPSVIVQSFSLRRNLPSLIRSEKRSKLNLQHVDGFRALTMMIILLSHASIPLIKMPLKNVHKLEGQFDRSWFPIAMAGNTYTVQLFFVIGGLLLAVNVLQQTKDSATVGVAYFIDRVKNRLIRILPTYLFVVLFHASWYPSLHDGPIGDRFKDHCTTNWWTNLLFINNYIHPSEPCIQFSWYLGADFQLYLIGTAIMILIRNRPKLTKHVALIMVLIAFVVPFVIIYVHHLDATVMMILRYVLLEIRTLPYYKSVYIPFETNAGNYFFGMVAGVSYYKLKENPMAAEILKLKYLLPGSAAFFVAMNGFTPLLPSDHLPHASVWLAFFGSLLKSAWGIFPSIVLLHLAFRSTPSILVSVLQHPVLLVAAKLSYAVYLTQYGIIYAIYKHITYPLMYDGYTIMTFTAAIVTITFLIAFFLYLVIEVPFHTMLKHRFYKPTRKKQDG
ncbi:O-acyltransferase like protein-like [Anopheles ziemanni]|uniref:O-acyltransferase like protein-like n=1 Tax=Anopheles coustani TaxID=139045 RepID=UPI00265B31A0|nr:O-acyltransferase like protein-like [Anopheles coustani]XP_058177754.1 O-acyltransferase like protein-like [Anopheles ziemanni]